jgi:predicted O-linked N-acetylglucosamine transferase (SPINDLY family)
MLNINNSYLWIPENNNTFAENLIQEFIKLGIDPLRIVFAKRLDSLDEHLARYSNADLFLDTFSYNAHTTASDALWAGLPVLTQIGKTFPGRVAASLLTAVGLPELITHTPEEYEALAIDLAQHPEKLQQIKQKLAENRLVKPLFDTSLFTQHLEKAYKTMYERHLKGLGPDVFKILN